MDRLASCYFCGVAVEAPLEEYPVVPRDLRPSVEDQSTVVLCPECRRKLSTIVERVVAATSDPAQTALGDSATGTAGGPDTQSGSEEAPEATVERFDDERPNLVDFETSHERDEEMIAREADPNEERDAETTGEEWTDTPGGEHGADQPETDPTAETGDEQSGLDQSGQRESAAGGGQTSSQPERAANGADDGGTDSTADRNFSTADYNKIVRLLQNREFPVEAGEITTVAGSAYGIGHREADAVLDALVERGILERDGNQLYRSDD
ncbi:hypothetical protein [Halorhabdus rudnickae]|uniref:hypothetical protein n=1 Tax=Halorhabdus rudnickae TaxID=1775544 RepID=UPI001083FEA6|nr:hypothetical protein [Halorhabdus rudnickae]